MENVILQVWRLFNLAIVKLVTLFELSSCQFKKINKILRNFNKKKYLYVFKHKIKTFKDVCKHICAQNLHILKSN